MTCRVLRSHPLGDGMSGDTQKGGSKVRSLTKRVSESNQKFVFEL